MVWTVVILGLLPLAMDLFMSSVYLPWYIILGCPAVLLILTFIGGRHKEYNRIEVNEDGVVVENIFRDSYNFSLRFDEIKFVEFGVPQGRNSAPNIVIYRVDNHKSTIFLRLLRERDVKRLLNLLTTKIRFADIVNIERYLGIRKGLRPTKQGVKISKLHDYATLRFFRPKLSNFTKWMIIVESIVIVILLATELYFEMPFISSSICAVVFTIITYGVHGQESYVAISDKRLFAIGRFSGKTNSIDEFEDIENVYFTKWIDGVTRIIIYNNTRIKSLSFMSLNSSMIENLKGELELRGIKTYVL